MHKHHVLKVGDGRGFVVDLPSPYGRCVITAAHCLLTEERPHLPPPSLVVGTDEWIYPAWLGPLEGPLAVSAKCVFVESVFDVAVLGSPASIERVAAYTELVGPMDALTIADAPTGEGRGGPINVPEWSGSVKLLSLEGEWVEGRASRFGPWIEIEPSKLLAPGMSGSPILSMAGAAIGIAAAEGGLSSDSGGPVLLDCLPRRFLRREGVGGRR